MGDARRFLGKQASRLRFPNIDHLTANNKDFSLSLEMTMRENLMSLDPWSLATRHYARKKTPMHTHGRSYSGAGNRI